MRCTFLHLLGVIRNSFHENPYLLDVCGLIFLSNGHLHPYPHSMAKQKSITFRCAEPQHRRLEQALQDSPFTRTDLISTALEQFLSFAESEDIRELDIFALVREIDSRGSAVPFAEEA